MTHALAIQGATRAVNHANRVTPEWSERAFKYLCWWAIGRNGEPFMTEDVRQAAEKAPRYEAPPDARAWGAVILRAKREGKLEHAGYSPNKDPSCHGSPKSLWRWVA